jgi:pyrroline-5-carboxylate reductase
MSKKTFEKRLAVLGLGKMGGILLQAFFKRGLVRPEQVHGTELHPDRAAAVSRELKIRVGTDNAGAVRNCDVVLLCVKPQNVRDLAEEIAPHLSSDKLVVSIAASVPCSYIERIVERRVPVVRVMPNTPCMVGCGMTAICRGQHADETHLELTRMLFDTVGRTVVVDEKHMNAVTGLSGSGPAYVYVIIESLAEAGVKVGLPRDVATLLAAQTTLGAARVVLETGHHPALLKDAVTTPAGCTIDGLLELEEGKLRVTLIKAVVKAAHRAKELLMEE